MATDHRENKAATVRVFSYHSVCMLFYSGYLGHKYSSLPFRLLLVTSWSRRRPGKASRTKFSNAVKGRPCFKSRKRSFLTSIFRLEKRNEKKKSSGSEVSCCFRRPPTPAPSQRWMGWSHNSQHVLFSYLIALSMINVDQRKDYQVAADLLGRVFGIAAASSGHCS